MSSHHRKHCISSSLSETLWHLQPFLLLILHIKSTSSAVCSVFKTHLDLPNLLDFCFSSIVKDILISHLDGLGGLPSALQFSVLHLLPPPLDPNPLSSTLSKWWMNGWRNDHDKCLSVSLASLLSQGSKKSGLFFLLQLHKKLAPHFTSLLTLWEHAKLFPTTQGLFTCSFFFLKHHLIP